jgi:hypothetical protein
MRSLLAVMAVVVCCCVVVTSAGADDIVVLHPDYAQPELYFEDDNLIPDKMDWGFDGNLWVGNQLIDDAKIYQIASQGVGSPYGEVLFDPDAVVQTPDLAVWVGGGGDVWRYPSGSETPELIVDDGFPLPQPGNLVLAPNGDILANNDDQIVRVNPDGTLDPIITNNPNARGVRVSDDGYLYFVDDNQTSISRVLYDPNGGPIDATTVSPFLTGLTGLDAIGLIGNDTVLYTDLDNDLLYLGYLDGSSELFASVPNQTGDPAPHFFNADQGADGAIYISDGTNGTEAIWRVVPEPMTLSLLAIGGVALLRRRR